MEEMFLVGVSEIEITPRPGLEMDGYVARVGVNTGVHDPLMAQVLVVESRGRRAALVTLDLLAVGRDFADLLRADLAGLVQTSPDAILICASHTHAGPRGLQNLFRGGSPVTLDEDVMAFIRQRVLHAAGQAFERRSPARLRSATGDLAGLGGDRNHREQPVDSTVTAISFEGSDGEVRAILFHYACHPTVLSADNRLYSADFPGAARRRIREAYPNAVCLYVNGAAGNVSTRYFRRDQSFEEVERLGRLPGDRVVELLADALPVTPALDWACDSLELPLRRVEPQARRLDPSGDARIDTVRAEGLIIEAQLQRVLREGSTQATDLCALKIGPWILLGVPGEAFNDLAHGLRDGDPYALVAGYTNDYLGYFPTSAAIEDATYEALSSRYDARAHALLHSHLDALANRLRSQK